MQSNQKCMKEILKYVDTNTGVEIDNMDNQISLKSIGLLMVIRELTKDNKFTVKEVIYNVLKCNKYHLIEASILINQDTIVAEKSRIYDITIEGENFLNDKLVLGII